MAGLGQNNQHSAATSRVIHMLIGIFNFIYVLAKQCFDVGWGQRMWGTFYGHSAYIQKNTCNMSKRWPEPDFQNLVSEHSIEGAPASLYNLTKRAPDP